MENKGHKGGVVVVVVSTVLDLRRSPQSSVFRCSFFQPYISRMGYRWETSHIHSRVKGAHFVRRLASAHHLTPLLQRAPPRAIGVDGTSSSRVSRRIVPSFQAH